MGDPVLEMLESGVLDFHEREKLIYSLPFDIQRHKLLPFHPSIELLMGPDGALEYARPSHQERLIAKAMEANGWTRQEVMDACPREYYFDYMSWLSKASGGWAAVWALTYTSWMQRLTKEQVKALRRLKLAGLYRGRFQPPATEKIPAQK